MRLELRVQEVSDQHIEPYVELSRAEFGDSVAVSQSQHLRWKFLENPQGSSVGIHLYCGDRLVARIVALSRVFVCRGVRYRAAHLVDFLVHPEARGMQALLQLMKGLKQLSGFDFLLVMAPNSAGAAVWEKFVKMRAYFDLDVAVTPLRPATLLKSSGRFSAGAIVPTLDWAWGSIVKCAAGLVKSPGQLRIESEWPDATEIDRMFSAAPEDRAVGLRSSEFLDWRYRRSPVFRYKVNFLRINGELNGYFVTRRTTYEGYDCEFLVDAFGTQALTASHWHRASSVGVLNASRDGAAMVMIFGNTSWGPLSEVNRLPYLVIPRRFLPRKTSVYAEWLTAPGFEIQRESFYVALGDSDVI